MLLIPAIDLRGGRCVRLYQGDFAAETRYDLEPYVLLQRYRALGATWLHVVDLDGAKDGVLANRAVILSLARARTVHLQVGGGVRSPDTIDDLLRHGVERVVVGSAALERPEEVAGWLAHFGPERIALAMDVRLNASGVPYVRTRGWTQESQVTLWDALGRYPTGSVRHVLCTDIERDGALTGPSLELYRQCLTRLPSLAWQASGGVRSAADLDQLAQLGVSAAISGKALLEEQIPLTELKPFLPGA